MKKLFVFSLLLLMSVYAAGMTISINVGVRSDDDLSDYFDLELLATQFAKSRNLNDLERRINDPIYHISNLDLNEDGYIDFIRVLKQSNINEDMIILQAVLGANYFQDVATIYIDRNKYKNDYILIVGDPYLFGEGYWIEPDFYFTPRLIKWLWRNAHYDYFSPYRWGHYPDYFAFSRILPYDVYWNNVHSWIDYNHHYHYVNTPRIYLDMHFDRSYHRNDHFNKYPNKKFNDRNSDFKNKRERSDNIRREKNFNQPRVNSGTNTSRQIDTRSNRNVERKEETRPAPERKVQSRPAPERKVESRPAPERKVESRPAPERKVESRPAPARESKAADAKPERIKVKKEETK